MSSIIINKHLSKDSVLESLINYIQLPQIIIHQNLFRELTESIIYQQLSVKVAAVIAQRFYNLLKTNDPGPNDILAVDLEDKRSIGLSYQKANYIENIARFWIEHSLHDVDWSSKTDEEIIELLTQIKGVGQWTVEMVLMFHLGREDIFPVNDHGIRTQMTSLYGLSTSGKQLTQELMTIAESWKPYRTAACRYIWKSKDTK